MSMKIGEALAGDGNEIAHIDLLIDTDPDNEASIFKALEYLPDKASRELIPGDVKKYVVVRVADEIVVDL